MKHINIIKYIGQKNKLFFITLLRKTKILTMYKHITSRNNAIFTFHRINGQNDDQECYESCPNISVNVFQAVIELIHSVYQVVPIRELFIKKSVPLLQAAITFDDGWVDIYRFAFPILQRFNIPATIFMTVGKIGSDELFWQQKFGHCFKNACGERERALRHLLKVDDEVAIDKDLYIQTVQKFKYKNKQEIKAYEDELLKYFQFQKEDRFFLNEDEMQEMSYYGVDYGSHTVNHVILTNESMDTIEMELAESKRELEIITGKKIDMISYPNGNVRPDIVAKAYELGYRYGCGTHSGSFSVNSNTDPMMIPRIDADWKEAVGEAGVLNADLFYWICR